MFVPSGESIQEVLNKSREFFSWGPFGFITEAIAAFNAPAAEGSLGFDIPIHVPTVGVVSTAHVSLTGGITETSAWQFMRGILGVCVWFGFVGYLVKVLTPYFSH